MHRSYGTSTFRAYAHVGPSSGPNRSDAGMSMGNGFDATRGHAHIGPASAEGMTGQSAKPAGAHVGPESSALTGQNVGHPGRVLDGNTDTRGLVADEEREHLQTFGAELRRLRKQHAFSQENLGKLAGIGTTHISRLEQGRRRPSVDAIKALARVLSSEDAREATEQHLASLAGDSLREGAARRRRKAENKHRREAAKDLSKTAAKVRRLVADRERRGVPVPDSMRMMADLDISRFVSPVQDDPDISGFRPKDSKRDPREDIRDLIRLAKKGRR